MRPGQKVIDHLDLTGPQQRGVYDADAQNVRDDGTNCGNDVAVNSNALTGFPGYCLPYIFESDALENIELGVKTTLLDGSLRLNGALYRIDWEDIQVSQFDSQNISILTIVDNGGDAEITGLEMDMAWAVNDNLTVFAAASFNDTELVYVDPAFDIVVADAGSMLPLTPETQFQRSGSVRVGVELQHERTLAIRL